MKNYRVFYGIMAALLCVALANAGWDEKQIGGVTTATTAAYTRVSTICGQIGSAWISVAGLAATADVKAVTSHGQTLISVTKLSGATNIYPLLVPAKGSDGNILTENAVYTYVSNNVLYTDTIISTVLVPVAICDDVTWTIVNGTSSTGTVNAAIIYNDGK